MDGPAPTALVRPPSDTIPRRGLRLGLGTLLWLVAATAPVVALFVRIDDPEVATPLMLSLVLTGLAVGAARRARTWKVAAQVGLTACVGLALIEVHRYFDNSTETFLYTALAVFALTVVAPLMIRNSLDGIGEGRRAAVKNVAEVAWNVGLNVAALLAFLFVAEMGWSLGYSGHSVRTISVPTPRPIYGATTGDGLDDMGEPASLTPSKGPYSRGCEAPVYEEGSSVLQAGSR